MISITIKGKMMNIGLVSMISNAGMEVMNLLYQLTVIVILKILLVPYCNV